ncbi:uncharacterized protein LOC126957472 isoform X4 [Macaca thibetana thibetana]|uniref:uncharacterized protein LOC126957472 isoform X4 n=1 Tax=Macaca thibetana thibetana TaxID=257877 RepID=UPI0021BCC721|nr:uncharacterized protein LOC126957472 isoform X4 [Macaca thibetana thibetana]
MEAAHDDTLSGKFLPDGKRLQAEYPFAISHEALERIVHGNKDDDCAESPQAPRLRQSLRGETVFSMRRIDLRSYSIPTCTNQRPSQRR